jgi:hypothetical protein
VVGFGNEDFQQSKACGAFISMTNMILFNFIVMIGFHPMTGHLRAMSFCAAFSGIIPHAPFAGQIPRATQ